MSERNRTGDKSTGPRKTGSTTGVAPGRVNLIGEHVDYNGGRCLPIALTRCTTSQIALRNDDNLRVTSGSRAWSGRFDELDHQMEGPDTWVLYVAGVLVALGVDQGMDIAITSDVPVGAGLSSSAALECSVAVAVNEALGLDLSPEQLVEACVRAERETVGAPTGGLDQAIAIYGEAEHALLIDFATDTREQVAFDPSAHGLAVLVVDTKVSHELTDGGYGSRRDQSHEAARLLGLEHVAEASLDSLDTLPEPYDRRARHVVTEVQRVDEFVAALGAGEWPALGPLLDASHASLRDDYEVSCVELDVAVEAARSAGALGARMTGGGFGGSAIALVPVGLLEKVREAIGASFSGRGMKAPDFFLAEPGPGARVG